MRIIFAPDSFKGSLTSKEVIATMIDGAKAVYPDAEYIALPIADGGEGTVEAILSAVSGERKTTVVTGPYGEKVKAEYGVFGQMAVMEMANCSGLTLALRNQLNPLKSTTYGTGEMIKHLLDEGVKKIIIGIGGSATNDGGTGALQAMGVRFLDKNKNAIDKMCGEKLKDIENIDISNFDSRLERTHIEIMCDVTNPLTGPNGATSVYGPQKGADAQMLDMLEAGMLHYQNKLKTLFHRDIGSIPGSGAAGGLGAALIGFCKGKLVRGIDKLLEIVDFEDKLKSADFVFTGEGKVDNQSVQGKVIHGILAKAKKAGVPVIVIAGSKENTQAIYDLGATALFAIQDGPMSLEMSLKNSKRLIADTTYNICRLINAANISKKI